MARLPANRAPTHPGDMLLNEFIKPLGITQMIWDLWHAKDSRAAKAIKAIRRHPALAKAG